MNTGYREPPRYIATMIICGTCIDILIFIFWHDKGQVVLWNMAIISLVVAAVLYVYITNNQANQRARDSRYLHNEETPLQYAQPKYDYQQQVPFQPDENGLYPHRFYSQSTRQMYPQE